MLRVLSDDWQRRAEGKGLHNGPKQGVPRTDVLAQGEQQRERGGGEAREGPVHARTGVLAQGEEFEAREAAERGGYLSVQAVAEQLQLF